MALDTRQRTQESSRQHDGDAPVLPVTVIEPMRGWQALRLHELREYKALLFYLALRDLKVRYKQAALGLLWVVLQPVLTMALFTIVFGHLARLPSDGLPHPIFYLAALLPWQLFAGTFTRVSNCLVSSANLITKVYFPRVLVPVSTTALGIVDFAVAFMVLLALLAAYRVTPHWGMLLLPAFVLLALGAALGLGLWVAVWNVRYRDMQHIVPFLVQLGMFASPVVYPVSLVPEGIWRTLYTLNPMVGVIQGFRWAISGQNPPDLLAVAISAVIVLVLFTGGIYYFRRAEQTFADVV
jgi:lipopolysaccharide transport system permease protein